eukprot:3941537-Rhodomonas_salina.10
MEREGRLTVLVGPCNRLSTSSTSIPSILCRGREIMSVRIQNVVEVVQRPRRGGQRLKVATARLLPGAGQRVRCTREALGRCASIGCDDHHRRAICCEMLCCSIVSLATCRTVILSVRSTLEQGLSQPLLTVVQIKQATSGADQSKQQNARNDGDDGGELLLVHGVSLITVVSCLCASA